MLNELIKGILGGLMIAIGGCVYLNVGGGIVGAFFFAVALVSICYKGFGLYTGRVGYLPEKFSKDELAGLGMTLLGNVIGTFLVGGLVSVTMGDGMGAVADSLAVSKLATPWYLTLLRAVLCGVLMYLAVSIYRERNTITGIVFCVPAFILAGFEHSIADMFYFAASSYRGFDVLGLLLLIVVGNAIGGMMIPLLLRLGQFFDATREFEVELSAAEDEPSLSLACNSASEAEGEDE